MILEAADRLISSEIIFEVFQHIW